MTGCCDSNDKAEKDQTDHGVNLRQPFVAYRVVELCPRTAGRTVRDFGLSGKVTSARRRGILLVGRDSI
jgi:hypothetical protein